MPILGNGKNLMLEVFKTKLYKVAIGAGSTYFSETVIPWGTVMSGALNMSSNYADIIALRYNAGAVISNLRFRDASNNVVKNRNSGIGSTPQATKGAYVIIDIPVTITSV